MPQIFLQGARTLKTSTGRALLRTCTAVHALVAESKARLAQSVKRRRRGGVALDALEGVIAGMPPAARDVMTEGVRRLAAYQDLDYAGLYLERLQAVREADADGTPRTTPVPQWESLRPAPPHPDAGSLARSVLRSPGEYGGRIRNSVAFSARPAALHRREMQSIHHDTIVR